MIIHLKDLDSTSDIYIHSHPALIIFYFNNANTCRAFSEGVATDNKLRSGQAYRTLPYAVELRPKMGSQEVFKNGFVFPEKDVSNFNIVS